MLEPLLYRYYRHVLKKNVTKVNRFNYFPLADSPPILLVYTPSGLDHVAKAAALVPQGTACHFLIMFNWFMNPVQVYAFISQARAIRRRHPSVTITPLCNSVAEFQAFQRLGPDLDPQFINQNIVLDENLYKVDEGISKRHDAVYNARMMPFKRFELAAEVPNLAIITCGWKTLNRDYFNRIHTLLVGAYWHNLDAGGNYRKLDPREVTQALNAARCGLIMSKAEGACFAATEYLLCGLPVVSCESKGGRETLFTPDTARIVPDDARAVADAVAAFKQRSPSPADVRSATLGIIRDHRDRFCRLVDRLSGADVKGSRPPFRWGDAFSNKMMEFTDLASFSQFIEKTGK